MTFCAVFPDVLSRIECGEAIAAAEARGFEAMGTRYPVGYRDNDRAVRDDPALAAQLFARLRPLLPPTWAGGWTLSRLNPRFRFCRYRDGQQFTKHRDGAWAEGAERSWLTVMLYLNDAGEFEGGATRFYPGGPVAPRAGQAIVFEHALWHDGAPVTRGTKYVMRTDVMYARDELAVPATGGGVDPRIPGVATASGGAHGQNEARPASPAVRVAGDGRGAVGTPPLEAQPARAECSAVATLHRARVVAEHAGYVWALRAGADGRLISGGRDGTVRRDGAVVRANLPGSATAVLEVAGALWVGGRHGQLDDGGRAWAAHEGAVLGLERLGDGSVVSCGADGAVRRWSPTGEAMGTLQQHGGWVWGLAIDGGRIRAAVEPTTCIAAGAWGARDGSVTRDDGFAWRAHDGAVTCLLRLGGSWVTGGEDGAVRVWSAEGVLREEGHHDDFVRCLAVLDGRRFASGSYDGTVVVWASGVT